VDASAPFWVALLLAIFVPMLLGRRREKRWFVLAILIVLPILALQLAELGAARRQWQTDLEHFRTQPQHLRFDETTSAVGTYDPARDTVSFQLPDRTVTIGPPKLQTPAIVRSPRRWAEGVGVGFVLVSIGFMLGISMSRTWPARPLPLRSPPPLDRRK